MCLQCGRPGFNTWIGKIPWHRKRPTHSSILAWRIPWTEEPGGLQSMGSKRVGDNSFHFSAFTWKLKVKDFHFLASYYSPFLSQFWLLHLFLLLLLFLLQFLWTDFISDSTTENSALCNVVCSKWEGNPKQRRYMYMYSWFTLLYTRN